MSDRKKETAYLVGEDTYLHLRETAKGFSYSIFQTNQPQKVAEGVIDRAALERPDHNTMTQVRTLALERSGLPTGPAAEVSVNMLARFADSDVRYRSKVEPETLPKDDIRFITGDREEKFRIPNGGTIEVDYPSRHFSAKCYYLDDFHARIDGEIYNIAQFSEMLERSGGSCRPEPEIPGDRAAWQLGGGLYLTVREEKQGWAFTTYDRYFHEKESGVLKQPELSAREARDAVKDLLGMRDLSQTRARYDFVKENAAKEKDRPSVLEKLKNARSAGQPSRSVKHREEMCL